MSGAIARITAIDNRDLLAQGKNTENGQLGRFEKGQNAKGYGCPCILVYPMDVLVFSIGKQHQYQRDLCQQMQRLVANLQGYYSKGRRTGDQAEQTE